MRSLKCPRKCRLGFFSVRRGLTARYAGPEMAVVPEDAHVSVFSCFCLEGRAEHLPGGRSPGASVLSGGNITGPGCPLEVLMMPCTVSQSCGRSAFGFFPWIFSIIFFPYITLSFQPSCSVYVQHVQIPQKILRSNY